MANVLFLLFILSALCSTIRVSSNPCRRWNRLKTSQPSSWGAASAPQSTATASSSNFPSYDGSSPSQTANDGYTMPNTYFTNPYLMHPTANAFNNERINNLYSSPTPTNRVIPPQRSAPRAQIEYYGYDTFVATPSSGTANRNPPGLQHQQPPPRYS